MSNIVLFRNDGVTGAMSLGGDLDNQQTSSLTKVLRVVFSDEVSAIRFSENILKIQTGEASGLPVNPLNEANSVTIPATEPAPWLPVSRQLIYGFESIGPKIIYYQFANDDRTQLSPIYSLSLSIDAE